MLLTCGFIFFLAGMIMQIWPPKKINMWYGYRTSLSTSSDRAWELAQKHSAKMMLTYGVIMIVVGFVTDYLSRIDRYNTGIVLTELIILLPLFIVLIMFSTHQYLKKKL